MCFFILQVWLSHRWNLRKSRRYDVLSRKQYDGQPTKQLHRFYDNECIPSTTQYIGSTFKWPTFRNTTPSRGPRRVQYQNLVTSPHEPSKSSTHRLSRKFRHSPSIAKNLSLDFFHGERKLKTQKDAADRASPNILWRTPLLIKWGVSGPPYSTPNPPHI